MLVLGIRSDPLQLSFDLSLYGRDLLDGMSFGGIVRDARVLNRFGDLGFEGGLLLLEFDEGGLEFVCCRDGLVEEGEGGGHGGREGVSEGVTHSLCELVSRVVELLGCE